MTTYNIITMTSWHKRISQCAVTIYSLLQNSVRPDLIILNLSIDEFMNQHELPSELITLADAGYVTINWVKRNTGVFKKVLPTVQMLANIGDMKYNLFSVDDDYIYDRDYIKLFLDNSRGTDILTAYMHPVVIGNCMMYKSYVFNRYRTLMDRLTDDIIKVGISDYYYQSFFKHMRYNIRPLNCRDLMKIFNPIFPNSKNTKQSGKYDDSRVALAHRLIDAIRW